ncbi:MAG: twin-arginine translocase TatA/TatE family subunit [Actinomycetota bacterium]
MGSLSFSEIILILLVILIVFGPRRLPELARRAGELAKKLRTASASLSESLGVDYEATVEPIRTAKREIDGIKSDLTKAVSSVGLSEDSEADAAAVQPTEEEDREETTETP